MHPFELYKLRPMIEADLKLVLAWRNSERVRVNMYSEELITWENHHAWFLRVQNNSSCRYFIVEHMDKPIGVVNFTDIDRIHNKCNWGFYIGDTNAQRGSGTILGYLGLVEAFEHLNVRKVCAEVFSFNEASLRFHRRLGFKQEGYLSQHVKKHNKYEDIILFACFSDYWLVQKYKIKDMFS